MSFSADNTFDQNNSLTNLNEQPVGSIEVHQGKRRGRARDFDGVYASGVGAKHKGGKTK